MTLSSIFSFVIATVSAFAASASAPTISYYPDKPVQGDPIVITVSDAEDSPARFVLLGSKPLEAFEYRDKTTAFVGTDIKQKAGNYPVLVSLENGLILRSSFALVARPKVSAPLGIPEKLGGNTATSVATLVSTLEQENKTLVGLKTADRPLWTEPFGYPTANPYVTDNYGYSRSTVGVAITHKGTDFRGNEGTPIMAVNDGVVRLVQLGRNYGNTIAIDHGLGVQSFYMHLSRTDVKVGDTVEKGQAIGMAGKTGYAEAAHLHLTVRIGDISIDPKRFLGFFE